MAPHFSTPFSTSSISRVSSATTKSTIPSVASYGALDHVPFPAPGDSLDDVESVPVLSDDEDDTCTDVARGQVRGRRDSTASIKTLRGRKESSSVQKWEDRPSKRAAPSPRRARPFKRTRAIYFTIGGVHEQEADWSDKVDGCKFSPSATNEGFIQLNPMAPSSARNHASTAELAELIALIADEAEAAKALDRASAAVLNGMPVQDLFRVSIKFAKHHIAVWDVDFQATYAIECVLYVKDARPFKAGRLQQEPVNFFTVDWRTVLPARAGQEATGETAYETSRNSGEAVGLHRHEVAREMDPARGIHNAKRWEWIPAGTPGTCRGGGWAMRVWVPVPMSVLEGRAGSVASFVRASVGLEDFDLESFVVADAEAKVTVENLRRDRDMKVSSRSL